MHIQQMLQSILRLRVMFLVLLLMLVSSVAWADVDTSDPASVTQEAFNAILHKDYWVLAGAVLSGVFLALQTWGPWKGLIGGDPSDSDATRDWKSYLGVLVLALVGGFGHALIADAAFNTELVMTTLKAAMAAVFTFATVKKGAVPLLGAVKSKPSLDEPPF